MLQPGRASSFLIPSSIAATSSGVAVCVSLRSGYPCLPCARCRAGGPVSASQPASRVSWYAHGQKGGFAAYRWGFAYRRQGSHSRWGPFSITSITGWLQCAGHALASLCRSSSGSYVPVGDTCSAVMFSRSQPPGWVGGTVQVGGPAYRKPAAPSGSCTTRP